MRTVPCKESSLGGPYQASVLGKMSIIFRCSVSNLDDVAACYYKQSLTKRLSMFRWETIKFTSETSLMTPETEMLRNCSNLMEELEML